MEKMYVFSSFEHSTHLELAISEIERLGIQSKNILAITLSKKIHSGKIIDTKYSSDDIGSFDTAAIGATFSMVLGVIYGYVLAWGPVIWGLIGMFTGGAAGFIIDLIPKRNSRKKNIQRKNPSEVILIIKCDKSQVEYIEDILLNNLAFGVGKFENDNKAL